ncbi:hypothetical protein ABW19_dt0203008 [Dactylella cylindrospora]|nr:hypothetical protein ABW19_dt0203008 [Dactylella cylindrospora]
MPLPETGSVDDFEHNTVGDVYIVPLPCTTVAPQATFTMSTDCTAGVGALPVETQQNTPPGPYNCDNDCGLLRRLTGTCCGFGGYLGNAILIPVGFALPFALLLPLGFVPIVAITIGGVTYPAGVALAVVLLVLLGTTLAGPFLVPFETSLEEEPDEQEQAGESNIESDTAICGVERIQLDPADAEMDVYYAGLQFMMAEYWYPGATVPTGTGPSGPVPTDPSTDDSGRYDFFSQRIYSGTMFYFGWWGHSVTGSYDVYGVPIDSVAAISDTPPTSLGGLTVYDDNNCQYTETANYAPANNEDVVGKLT